MAKPIHTKGEELLKLSEIDASDRIRELSSDVMKYIENELAPSIADHGLIQPIVIDQNKKLIAGGCRYTAFKLLQYDKIPVVYREKLTASDSILLELEENLRRRKMRWQETTLGIYKAHQIKKKESSRIHAKWGVRQTGALLGVSHATVGDALIIAEYLIKGDAEILEALTFEKAQQVLFLAKKTPR
jgi:Predicted transcriptional regulators